MPIFHVLSRQKHNFGRVKAALSRAKSIAFAKQKLCFYIHESLFSPFHSLFFTLSFSRLTKIEGWF